jgi:hypothetical protein
MVRWSSVRRMPLGSMGPGPVRVRRWLFPRRLQAKTPVGHQHDRLSSISPCAHTQRDWPRYRIPAPAPAPAPPPPTRAAAPHKGSCNSQPWPQSLTSRSQCPSPQPAACPSTKLPHCNTSPACSDKVRPPLNHGTPRPLAKAFLLIACQTQGLCAPFPKPPPTSLPSPQINAPKCLPRRALTASCLSQSSRRILRRRHPAGPRLPSRD